MTPCSSSLLLPDQIPMNSSQCLLLLCRTISTCSSCHPFFHSIFFSPSFSLYLTFQIVSAVQYCHQKCIVHRDLKVRAHTHATELHWVSKHKQVCSLSLSLFVHINVKVRIWLFEMKSCYHEQVAQRVIRRMIQCPSLSGLNTHTISCMCTHPLSMHFS